MVPDYEETCETTTMTISAPLAHAQKYGRYGAWCKQGD
jgi:hypothetical protein